MSSQTLDALKQAMSKSGLTKAFIAESIVPDGIEPLACETGCLPGCAPGCLNTPSNSCSLF